MNCNDFERRIHRLLDHRVLVTRDKHLARHAQVCRHCRGLLEAYADLETGLTVWETPQLDDDFSQRVVAALEPARPVTRVPFARLVMAAIAAGILVALFPTVRHAISSSASKPTFPVVALPTPGPDVAVPEELPLDPDLSALALLPPDFLGVPSAFIRPPIGDMWQEWALTLARGRQEILEPMAGIRDGLRPITATLTGTIDALRTAIPLGIGGQSEGASGDSASIPRSQSDGLAV